MATVMKMPGTAPERDVVAAVKALLPDLRAAQAESDELARPPEHIVAKLREAGAYHLTIPKEYGGIGADMATWMETITEIARGDAGVAWAVTLVASCNWTLSSFFPKHVVDEVYSTPGATVAGIFTGRALSARKVEGGIFIDKGMWFFNSGVYQATWDMLGVPMFNEAGEVVGPGIALVPMSDVTLLDDWNPSGIRGSGSTNVSAENIFIPDERARSRAPMTGPRRASPSRRRWSIS
jgi:3-hydroxy-9,10-secoandrosta-1,3,5(10)-triene-9,17-dione monooxygenase